MAKKEEPRQSIRSRVASKFRHEDEPDVKKVTDEDDATVTGARTPKQTSRVGVPIEDELKLPLEPTYSVGAGAPPAEQKKLQATTEADRKALKKKQT